MSEGCVCGGGWGGGGVGGNIGGCKVGQRHQKFFPHLKSIHVIIRLWEKLVWVKESRG